MRNLIEILNEVFSSSANVRKLDSSNAKVLEDRITDLTSALGATPPPPEDEIENIILEKRMYEAEKRFLEYYRKEYIAEEYEYSFGGE